MSNLGVFYPPQGWSPQETRQQQKRTCLWSVLPLPWASCSVLLWLPNWSQLLSTAPALVLIRNAHTSYDTAAVLPTQVMFGFRAMTVILEMRVSFLGSLPPRQAFSSWDCKCYHNGLVKEKQLWSWARAAKPRFRVTPGTEAAALLWTWRKVQHWAGGACEGLGSVWCRAHSSFLMLQHELNKPHQPLAWGAATEGSSRCWGWDRESCGHPCPEGAVPAHTPLTTTPWNRLWGLSREPATSLMLNTRQGVTLSSELCSSPHPAWLSQGLWGKYDTKGERVMQSHSTAGSDKAGKFIPCNCTPVIIQVLPGIGKLQSGWGICCRRLLILKNTLKLAIKVDESWTVCT